MTGQNGSQREPKSDETPGVTPAQEFRRARVQGERITLTTGRVVRMRTVKPGHLLRLGKIPDILTEFVLKILYGKMTDADYQAFFTLAERAEHAVDMLESLRVVCTAALLEPRIAEEPQSEDEIHIDDLEDGEQRLIFDLALLEASGLTRFRLRQESGVDALPAGEGDEQPAEPVASGADRPDGALLP